MERLKGLFVALALFAYGCAQVAAPTGGPVDETPPQVLEVVPAPGTVNWTGGVVRMTFDEYVQVKNVREQWLISPPVSQLPAYRLRGKTLEVDWTHVPLDSGMTVVLDLGESVVDLHEGNPLVGGVWAASTGPKIDTLTWKGNVIHRDFAEPASGIRVLLYPGSWALDSLRNGARPRYVGVTNEQGIFEVDFIAPGVYWPLAIDDVNKNWAWDDGEAVGWGPRWNSGDSIESKVVLFPTPAKSSIYAGRPLRDATGLIAAEWHGPEDLKHEAWEVKDGVDFDWIVDEDSVWIWGADASMDTLIWKWSWEDEGGSDTLLIRDSKAIRSRVAVEGPRGKLVSGGSRALRFEQPVQALDVSKWNAWNDSVSCPIDSVVLRSPFEVQVHLPEEPNQAFELLLIPGALSFMGDAVSDSMGYKWRTWPHDHLSELMISAFGSQESGRLSLLDAQGRTLDQRALLAGDSIEWLVKDLLPGAVDLIWESDRWSGEGFHEVDVDAWRQGDVRLKAKGGLDLRSNWTLDWIWEVETTKFPKLEY